MQQTICLSGFFIKSVGCTYSFEFGFMWYFQCLMWAKFLAPFWVSGGHKAADKMSGRCHSVVCMMCMFIFDWFYMVHSTFVLA